jgi:hypothetical protein
MNNTNPIIHYADEIIQEAKSDMRTWTTSFHDHLIKSVSRMSEQEANLFIQIIMNEILTGSSQPFSRFKLCQICSIIRNQDLKSFQNAFLPFQCKISEYLNSKTDSALHSVIKSHLTNLYQAPLKSFSNLPNLYNNIL